MKKIACVSVLFAFSAGLPAAAQTAPRLSPEELVARAAAQNVCGGNGVSSAVYESASSNRVKVTCQSAGGTGEIGASEFGVGMGMGTVAAGGLVFLVALAAGGGNGTPSTTGTN